MRVATRVTNNEGHRIVAMKGMQGGAQKAFLVLLGLEWSDFNHPYRYKVPRRFFWC